MEKDQKDREFAEEKKDLLSRFHKEQEDNRMVGNLKDKQIKLVTSKLKIAAAELIKWDQLIQDQ